MFKENRDFKIGDLVRISTREAIAYRNGGFSILGNDFNDFEGMEFYISEIDGEIVHGFIDGELHITTDMIEHWETPSMIERVNALEDLLTQLINELALSNELFVKGEQK